MGEQVLTSHCIAIIEPAGSSFQARIGVPERPLGTPGGPIRTTVTLSWAGVASTWPSESTVRVWMVWGPAASVGVVNVYDSVLLLKAPSTGEAFAHVPPSTRHCTAATSRILMSHR